MTKYLDSPIEVKPFGSPSSPIWIVGESPGKEEIARKRPFVGKSGEKLWKTLAKYGINESDCFVTNLCPFKPKNNDFTKLLENDAKSLKKISDLSQLKPVPELKAGIRNLFLLAKAHKPKVILTLGYYPTGVLSNVWYSISKTRGSVYECLLDKDIKILASYHPSFILRNPSAYSAFDNDMYRLNEIKHNRFTILPQSLIITPTESHIQLYEQEPYLAVDIESVKVTKKTIGMSKIRCISFARSKTESLCITLDDSAQNDIWIRRLLECPAKKIFHNGSGFDVPMLELNNYTVNNYTDDTLVQSHVLYPELPHTLAFLTSTYTTMPYYKDDGKEEDAKGWSMRKDPQELALYCCRDTIATFWVWEELMSLLKEREDDLRIYQYEMELSKALIPVSHIGLKIDRTRNKEMIEVTQGRIDKNMAIMNIILNDADFNPNSPDQVKHILYEYFGLPKQFKGRGVKKSITSDNDALAKLLSIAKTNIDKAPIWKLKFKFIETLMALREYNKLMSSQLKVIPSREGRVRGVYRATGTETGRLACNKYVDGTGMNMQTITRDEVEL